MTQLQCTPPDLLNHHINHHVRGRATKMLGPLPSLAQIKPRPGPSRLVSSSICSLGFMAKHRLMYSKVYGMQQQSTQHPLPHKSIHFLLPQDTIASHVKSEYREKLKETLGTPDSPEILRAIRANPEGPATQPRSGSTDPPTNLLAAAPNKNSKRQASATILDGATVPTTPPPSPQHVAVEPPPAATAPAKGIKGGQKQQRHPRYRGRQ